MNSLGAANRSRPAARRLKVFAFDPSIGGRIKTAGINQTTLQIPWEQDACTGCLLPDPGPVGEYVEVVDVDPASNCFYAPVDLNQRELLATDGLDPLESSPQFHQQMVYAVAMTTIDIFERALGRRALWSPRRPEDDGEKALQVDERSTFKADDYVQRLRIYPHALREANAYYSPRRKALLFGYFAAPRGDYENVQGTMIFTCLSHDIVAHETTHALLDGLHPRFNEATNVDMRALHEAFADIVALFQRFSNAELLRHQIAQTRGDLETENLLGDLAQQVGRATGRHGALRSAIGKRDKNDKWCARPPDPTALDRTTSPHDRGAILVAAVFRAFISVYKAQTADLLRIATSGSGILPEGHIHPDLVNRLAEEAAYTARQLLQMCIRGLDYCPPVDLTFGDYLRGILTGDRDADPEDIENHRLALIEAFRDWGIYPARVRNMSLDALCYPRLDDVESLNGEGTEEVAYAVDPANSPSSPDASAECSKHGSADAIVLPQAQGLSDYGRWERKDRQVFQEGAARLKATELEPGEEEEMPASSQAGPPDLSRRRLRMEWDLETDRKMAFNDMRHNARVIHKWVKALDGGTLARLGLTRDRTAPATVARDREGLPSIEVHSVRTAVRRESRGSVRTELVVELLQRRRGYLDPEKQKRNDMSCPEKCEKEDFWFRSGCTIILNPNTSRFRYIIRTQGNVADKSELARIRDYLSGRLLVSNDAFRMQRVLPESGSEGFAVLHTFKEASTW